MSASKLPSMMKNVTIMQELRKTEKQCHVYLEARIVGTKYIKKKKKVPKKKLKPAQVTDVFFKQKEQRRYKNVSVCTVLKLLPRVFSPNSIWGYQMWA